MAMAPSAGVGIIKPASLSDQGVDSGLLREAWANQIYLESLQQEPLFNSPDLMEEIEVGDKPMALPKKIVMNVTPTGQNWKANRKVTLQFLKALSGTGRFGNAETQLGYEEQMQLKYSQFYSNDWSHAASGEAYGIDFRELSATQIYNYIRPLLAQWKAELDGYFYRSAIVETRSPNLAKAPLSLTQPLNPNWFLPGLDTTSQPAYSATAATLEDNVGAAMASVTATDNVFNVRRILTLADYLRDNYIKPVTIAGKQVYLLCLHPDEVRYNIDPSRSDSWAKYWIDSAALQAVDKVVPNVVGQIGDIICVRDQRAPTATLSGTSADYTISTGYLLPGRNDGRATGRTANVHFNLNYVLGENAIGKYESEVPHYEEQYDEYKKIYGIAYTGAFGCALCNWDLDTQTDSSIQSEGTYICATQR
jgi:hypothetical protein